MKKIGAALILLLIACGKRGDPHPPIPIIPKATTDLVVAQRGAKVLLAWSYPALTTAGKSLAHVRRVTVYRTIESLPVAPATVPPPLSPAQFVKLRNKVESIEGANLPAASSGARLTFEDSPQFRSSDGRPVRLTYAVVTEGESAIGDLSNLASILPLDVTTPPTALTATAKPEGVVLAWKAPGAKAFNVYRLGQGETFSELTKPINATPVAATTYTDVPPYAAYTYVVSAVAAPGIESDPSAAATVTFKDLLPPATPKNLSLLVETKAVRLLWDAVDAPDLAGYMVYRKEGVMQGDKIQEIPTVVPLMESPVATTYFVDSKADIGIAYRYAVTARDKNGNESERVWTDWVVIPKTP